MGIRSGNQVRLLRGKATASSLFPLSSDGSESITLRWGNERFLFPPVSIDHPERFGPIVQALELFLKQTDPLGQIPLHLDPAVLPDDRRSYLELLMELGRELGIVYDNLGDGIRRHEAGSSFRRSRDVGGRRRGLVIRSQITAGSATLDLMPIDGGSSSGPTLSDGLNIQVVFKKLPTSQQGWAFRVTSYPGDIMAQERHGDVDRLSYQHEIHAIAETLLVALRA
jgi:hypothetical protein